LAVKRGEAPKIDGKSKEADRVQKADRQGAQADQHRERQATEQTQKAPVEGIQGSGLMDLMQLAFAVLIIATVGMIALTVALWTEIRAFREMNEGLGTLIIELETAQTQMRAGIMAAILDRANADEKPVKGTAH
jgi:hypothetical protein